MTCVEARELASRALDGALGSDEAAALDEHLRGCGACRALRADLAAEQALLAELWRPVSAPAGFGERAAAGFPRSVQSRRRPWLAAAALLLVLLAATLAQPTARAGLELFLRQVVLREEPASDRSRLLPIDRFSLEEAQRLVPWRIRRPAALPDGYRLVAVYAGELHAFAVGPTIVLHYRQGDGPTARHLGLIQLRAAAEVSEPVEPGAASRVAVGGGSGLFIDGRWVEREGGQAWERGTLVRLIVEQDDLVLQLQADPRDGWDAERLAAVAASLR